MNADSRPALVILGTSGHAKVVIDCCRASGREIAGLLAEDEKAESLLGVPVIGKDARLDDRGFVAAHAFVVAIGEQKIRRRLTAELDARSARMATVVHPSCVVSDFAEIGEGSVLLPGAIVNAGTRIGRACILNTACSVDHDNRLDDGCQIGPGARLCGDVTCGEWSFVGTGAVVLPGRGIGEAAIVGAGAVVVEDVARGITVTGCPAQPRYKTDSSRI